MPIRFRIGLKGDGYNIFIAGIEEGVEFLTGVEAGRLQPDGTYSAGTVLRKADKKLRKVAEAVRELGKTEDESGKR